MKKRLAMILAVVMLLGVILPQAALAAPAGTYYLSVKIESSTATAKTLTATTGYGSENTLLAAEVVALINANMSKIESTFAGTGLRGVLVAGVNAFNAGGTAWTNYVNTYSSAVTGDFKDILKDTTSTYADLEVNVPNTVTYKGYTLTVTLVPYGDEPSTEVSAKAEQDADGNTLYSADIPEGAENVTITGLGDYAGGANTTIKLNNANNAEPIKVTIPVNNIKPGQVVVVVDEEGNETILPKSVVNEEGVLFELEGSATIKVIDNSKSFGDVPEDNWASDAVAFVSARELFQGVADDEFAPQDSMTRGMMVTVLYRLESEPDATVQNVFSDIQEDAYYTNAVYWAVAKGIVDGYEDASYRPDQNITRQELVTMLYRYAGKPAVADNTLAFADAEDVYDYAKDAMCWAVDSGIVEGVTDDTLCPLKLATRAEAATMLMRFCGYILSK